jgi:hypothetical protein
LERRQQLRGHGRFHLNAFKHISVEQRRTAEIWHRHAEMLLAIAPSDQQPSDDGATSVDQNLD